MAMRVLFTLQPAASHFHSLAPLAFSLRARGHEVAFACGRPFCPVVASTGFPVFVAGRDQFTFGQVRAQPMIDDLLAIARAWPPDLIVRETMEFGGCLAAERLGIPHASVQVGAHCPPEPPWDLIGAELAGLCAAAGLPGRPFDLLYPHLHLAFVPPSYQRLGAFAPPIVRYFRPLPFDGAGGEGLPDWVAALPARPSVYATLGTVGATYDPEGALRLATAVVDGLGGMPVNLILTVGRDGDPARLGPAPPNARVERYLPQSLILPHCDLVIAHGGWNTVMAALAHALPLVLIPSFADQPENARRCAALGVGLTLDSASLTPDRLREAVRAVSREPAFRDAAVRVRRELEALPHPDGAIAHLEGIVARCPTVRRPL